MVVFTVGRVAAATACGAPNPAHHTWATTGTASALALTNNQCEPMAPQVRSQLAAQLGVAPVVRVLGGERVQALDRFAAVNRATEPVPKLVHQHLLRSV